MPWYKEWGKVKEGLTNFETAKVLGISVSAAISRIHRGRLLLRDKLSDYFSMNGENHLMPQMEKAVQIITIDSNPRRAEESISQIPNTGREDH